MRTSDKKEGEVTCSLRVITGQEDGATTTYSRLIFFCTVFT
jgi:hypothetical protein